MEIATKVQSQFRTPEKKSGEGGEVILCSLLEGHLGAPKILSKMELKTSSQHYVHGLAISRTIAYHARSGSITYNDYAKSPYPVTETFDPNDPKYINLIIEDRMRDIETGLRFKIIGYLENYHDLAVQALGADKAGIDVAKLVEYGSSDPKMINLQEVGFSRGVAIDLLKKHVKYLVFTQEGELDTVDIEALLADSTLGEDSKAEVENILRKSPAFVSE